MEKEYSFDPIPLQLMWGAQCHFCNNMNYPINSKKEFPVRHMEKVKPQYYICDECLEKRRKSKMSDQMLLYAKLHPHKPMSSLKETIVDKIPHEEVLKEE